jgi:membrane-bound metal-dependent hydrolase YbcI (DUF457 family)
MPFTPYHFGPSAIIGLPLNRYLDVPVFVLANVVIDFEPLAVMMFTLDYPLHGFFHTFLIGGLVGLLFGVCAYPARPLFKWLMQLFRLPYQTGLIKMMLSGLLGIWLHVFIDSIMYQEMHPFWPLASNPFYRILDSSTIYFVCEICLIAAIVIYPAWAWSAYRKNRPDRDI